MIGSSGKKTLIRSSGKNLQNICKQTFQNFSNSSGKNEKTFYFSKLVIGYEWFDQYFIIVGIHLDQNLISGTSGAQSNGALMTTTTASGQSVANGHGVSPTMPNGNGFSGATSGVPVSIAYSSHLAHLAHQMNHMAITGNGSQAVNGLSGPHPNALANHHTHYLTTQHPFSATGCGPYGTAGYLPVASAQSGMANGNEHQHLAALYGQQANPHHLQISLEDHLKQQQLNGLVTTVSTSQDVNGDYTTALSQWSKLQKTTRENFSRY